MGLAGTPEVSPGDHACCAFATDDDQAQIVGKFARDAVGRRDRIFYLADRTDEVHVAALLDDAGLNARAMIDSGALHILHSSEMGLEDGFSRERQLGVWRKMTAAARDDHYRGLAVMAEMSWALSWKVDVDALIGYEATSNSVFTSGELSALCQYDRRLFDDDTLHRAGHAHRYAMSVGGDGCVIDYNRLRLHLGHRELELGGEVDLANVDFLGEQLSEQLADGDVVADCARLTFIDARGCRLLRAACKGEHGSGRLTLRNTPEGVARVMRVFDRLEPDG